MVIPVVIEQQGLSEEQAAAAMNESNFSDYSAIHENDAKNRVLPN